METNRRAPGAPPALLFPFLMVATLFFIWGFCHAMLDVLNKHFQNILHVSKAQSGFIQTSVFGAYFLLAFPSALAIRRIGYQKGILLGLAVLATGAFLFVPAGLYFKTFGAFLVALFVLSSGLACIETAANPYVTVLGPKEGAAGRLSVAQAFNSLAYILAPTIGGALIFVKPAAPGTEADFHSLILPYVVLGGVVLIVFGVFSSIRLPAIEGSGTEASGVPAGDVPLRRQPHFVWGIATQFLYIAAQVGVNAFAVNYILENAITTDASGAASVDPLFAWSRAVTGAAIARVVPSHVMLGLYGIANAAITLLVMANIPHVSWRILPFCWLFMSIMFPFIFAMSLRDLGEKTKVAASFQIMSIVGGAVAPPLMGLLADRYHSMAICFVLPLVGFVATTAYGFLYPRLLARSGGAAVAAPVSEAV